MPPKALKILLIVFGIILILAIVFLAIIRYTNQADDQNANANQNLNQTNQAVTNQNANQNLNLKANSNANQNTNIPVVSSQLKEEEGLQRTASLFAERFGSYSNHSNFENVVNLKVYMSRSMQEWADQFVVSSRAANLETAIYYGLTTSALSVKTDTFDTKGEKAEFTVSTQRREATGSTSNISVFYQDIVIKFIKEGGAWKVNEADWQDKK